MYSKVWPSPISAPPRLVALGGNVLCSLPDITYCPRYVLHPGLMCCRVLNVVGYGIQRFHNMYLRWARVVQRLFSIRVVFQ